VTAERSAGPPRGGSSGGSLCDRGGSGGVGQQSSGGVRVRRMTHVSELPVDDDPQVQPLLTKRGVAL